MQTYCSNHVFATKSELHSEASDKMLVNLCRHFLMLLSGKVQAFHFTSSSVILCSPQFRSPYYSIKEFTSTTDFLFFFIS